MDTEYRKNKATFHASPPPAAPRFVPVSPLGVPLSRPAPQRLVRAGGGRAGPPAALPLRPQATGAGLWPWSGTRLRRLAWDGGHPLAHAEALPG